MFNLSDLVMAQRVMNGSMIIKQVLQMEELADTFEHIKPFIRPTQWADMDALDMYLEMHDALLDYFIELEDNDSTGKVKEIINNFKFTVDSE